MSNLLPLEADMIEEGTYSLLRKRIEEFREKIRNETHAEKVNFFRRRMNAARELLSHSGEESVPSPRVFVSYNFKFSLLFRIIESKLQEYKCNIINGDDPIGKNDKFRDEIVSRIRSSCGFIAIWKIDMEKKEDERILSLDVVGTRRSSGFWNTLFYFCSQKSEEFENLAA